MSKRDTLTHLVGAGIVLLGSAIPALAQKKKPAARKPAAKKPPAKKPAAKAPTVDPNAAVITQIEKLGGRVGQIAQNDDRLEVSLRLAGMQATDAAVAPVKSLKKVIILDLGHTAVTDAALANVAGMTELTKLHLEQTKISDRGLSSLKGLKNLEYLNLYGTGITDAGLDQLTGLSKMKSLYVWQTKVTPAGVEKLKKALPQLEIVTGLGTTPPATATAAPAAAPEKK